MKRILLTMLLVALPAFGQVVVQTQNGTGVNSGFSSSHIWTYSAYGYPWFALAGSDRSNYVRVYAQIDNVTGWTGNGSTVTFTANNTLAAGDVVSLLNFTNGPFNWNIYQVVSATSTTFTISDGTTGTFTESTAKAYKTQGAGFTSNGTWTITTTTPCGGTGQPVCETYKLYAQDGSGSTSFTTAPSLTTSQTINFVVGPTPGQITESGSTTAGNYAIHSTIEFDLKFTSADDPTKTGTYHYVVAQNGGGYAFQGVAHITPGYRQIFKNRVVPLAGQVFGNSNQAIDWTIDTAPAGGDASLDFASSPQPVFHSGTVSGHYTIKGCPKVDHTPGACDKLGVWVSPNAPPAANTDKVELVPCDVDSTMSPASQYDIGPSKTYHDLLAIPQTWAAPMLIRVFNEGAAGSPTVYHNQLQIGVQTASGTWNQDRPAVVLCGVPNATTGELPIIDGDHSTTNSWTSPYVVGPYALVGITNQNAGPSVNDGNVKVFNHVTLSGLHIRNVSTGYQYYDQSGTLQNWGGAMGVRPTGVQYWSVIGVYAERVATPFFDDCNSQSGWNQCSLDTFYEGNRGVDYGTNGTPTEHMFYLQAFRNYSFLNLQEGGITGDQGTNCFSDRGTRSFHMYNRCYPVAGKTTASGLSGHSEIQDGYNYVVPDEYFGYQGAPSCATAYSGAPGCQGAFGGAAWFAGITEEHSLSDVVVGNLYYNDSGGGTKYMGLTTTHNTTGMDNSQKGVYSYNTFLLGPNASTGGGALFEDTRPQAYGTYDVLYTPVVWPRAFWANNIMPWVDNTSCAYTCFTTSVFGHAQMTFQTNLVHTGQVTPAANIQPTGWASGGVFHNGINTSYTFYDPGSITPINRFLSGFTSGNFPTYSTFPVNSTTGVPVSGSAAIGIATSLTGDAANYPPRFNPVDANMSAFTLRTDLSTLGAFDPASGGATPVSIAITPNPLTGLTSASGALTCTTTMSSGPPRDCISPACTSTNTGTLTISGLNWTSTTTAGTGTISCTAESLSAPGDAFTITAPSTGGVTFGGSITISGSVVIH